MRLLTVWALVRGPAFVHLDGKLGVSTSEVVATQVHTAVHALFDDSPAMSPTATPSGRAAN
ncbi:hypothetical protein ACFWFI_02665 [Streptomyces sp. NPDC060209]|uniref:hypothetical protein n=1 Tax=Streptomyces sp. NPDC060209 TaxID=3347073 RepID=UPI003658AAD6